jgi:hypothetical protein
MEPCNHPGALFALERQSHFLTGARISGLSSIPSDNTIKAADEHRYLVGDSFQ